MASDHTSRRAKFCVEGPARSEMPSKKSPDQWICIDENNMKIRILYPNPVCLLLTAMETAKPNAMVISWLTPINNRGCLIMSVNKARYSSSLLSKYGVFELAVPTSDLEETVLQIGKISGINTPKFDNIDGLQLNSVSIQNSKRKQCESNINVIEGSCALLRCHIETMETEWDSDHLIIKAKIDQAFVDERYWNNRNFIPLESETPCYLTFLGTQRFAYVVEKSKV